MARAPGSSAGYGNPAFAVAGITLAILASTPLVVTPTARAQETPGLEEIEESIETERDRAAALERESEAIATELTSLRDQLIEKAATLQDHEERLSAFERSMESLAAAVDVIETRLASDRKSAIMTLAALQRLVLTPPQTALFADGDPIDRARAAALLESIYPRLTAHAVRMRDDLAELAALRETIEAQRAGAATTAEELAGQTQELAALVERKQALLSETTAERQAAEARVAQLAEDAADLKDLIARLEAGPPTPKPATDGTQTAALPPADDVAAGALTPEIRAFPGEPGGLLLPVRGTLVRGYGALTEAGEASRGLVIQTRPGAQVVFPFDGHVVFAGPFRGYGLILIVEHGDGYHSLLAGLGRIDAQAGQWVLAGEPAGVMAAGTAENPELYIELRRSGQPIDPAPWFGLIAGG